MQNSSKRNIQASDDLPLELRQMVKAVLAVLGQVIRDQAGTSTYQQIEFIRKEMTRLRRATPNLSVNDQTASVLRATLKSFRRLHSTKQHQIAQAFTLMLELMNSCENAYRTFRLKAKLTQPENHENHQNRGQTPRPKSEEIIFVLTAHPTESRSSENVQIFQWIHFAITQAFENGFVSESDRIRHLIELSWKISIVREHKPTVADEAEHIYSIVLQEQILQGLVDWNRRGVAVSLRSWVGGDKDGHPGINEQTLQESLQISRTFLLKFATQKLESVQNTLKLLPDSDSPYPIQTRLKGILTSLLSLSHLVTADGKRVSKFKTQLKRFIASYHRFLKATHPDLKDLEILFRVFPALVIPLELRENAENLLPTQRNPETRDTSQGNAGNVPQGLARGLSQGLSRGISKMLARVRALSRGGDPRWYAGELILSLASSSHQIHEAARLVQKNLRTGKLPVVPLFEKQGALESSPEIVSEILKVPLIRKNLEESWNGTLELMVGYSDSAKEIGVLPSRIAISRALQQIEKKISSRQKVREKVREKIRLVFFHGSGGSVDRGGGSIQEQIAWWPRVSLQTYKSTVQGEMVDRLFSSPEIMNGQIQRFRTEARLLQSRLEAKENVKTDPALFRFSKKVENEYRRKTSSEDFLKLIQETTPYPFLSILRLGSRPSQRSTRAHSTVVSLDELRAIPWVLCWTQTRVLFPTWWGIGTAWRESTPTERLLLKKAFQKDPLFQSFAKLLGFTLAKVELEVWRMYLENNGMKAKKIESTLKGFNEEYKSAVQFVRFISGHKNLLWYRPWLHQSIRLRSPMIHPLNLLQIIGFEKEDFQLIRISVTGIASGMLTTG